VDASPHFLQAISPFRGQGLDEYLPLDPPLVFTVPDRAQAHCVYFRGGNSSDALVCVVLVRDREPMRLFPVGARAAIHLPLRVTEDLMSDTHLEVHVAAPEGVSGTIVVDLGLLVFT
jgi:assimilatory nitrate reductase catalytic subunit